MHLHPSSQDPVVFTIRHLTQDKQSFWLGTRCLTDPDGGCPCCDAVSYCSDAHASRSEDEPMCESALASPDVTGALNFVTN